MFSEIHLRLPHGWTRMGALLFMFAIVGLHAWSQQQRGKASYYPKRATGARTASGIRLHHDSMTCAHRYHPFGTLLKVTNLSNGKSVVVKVIDRGPFTRGRVIDLSWGAAKALGMLSQGVASVKVEVADETVIPMRPKDNVDLPKIDFELAEARYSFIEKWKEGDSEEEADTKRESPPRKKSSRPADTQEGHDPKKKSTRPRQPESKEERNTWSTVFDKIKNVF